jgi:hypothetical protein
VGSKAKTHLQSLLTRMQLAISTEAITFIRNCKNTNTLVNNALKRRRKAWKRKLPPQLLNPVVAWMA